MLQEQVENPYYLKKAGQFWMKSTSLYASVFKISQTPDILDSEMITDVQTFFFNFFLIEG